MEKTELELREVNLTLQQTELDLRIELFELRAPKTVYVHKTQTRTKVANMFFMLLFISAIAPILILYVHPIALRGYFVVPLLQLPMFAYLHLLAIGKIKEWDSKWKAYKTKWMNRAREHEQKRKAKI